MYEGFSCPIIKLLTIPCHFSLSGWQFTSFDISQVWSWTIVFNKYKLLKMCVLCRIYVVTHFEPKLSKVLRLRSKSQSTSSSSFTACGGGDHGRFTSLCKCSHRVLRGAGGRKDIGKPRPGKRMESWREKEHRKRQEIEQPILPGELRCPQGIEGGCEGDGVELVSHREYWN